MPQAYNPDVELYALTVAATLIILIFVLSKLYIFINDFSSELRFLNTEIERTEGAEQKHWSRQRKRLWLSLIPFVKY